MQIGAADGRGGDAHDGIIRIFDFRLRHVLQPHIPNAAKNNSFHRISLLAAVSVLFVFSKPHK
jgi:hypothetical protein